MLPAEHLLAVGFKTVRHHPTHPRLRLELRSTLSWKEDVEMAIDRLLGAVQKEPALRPCEPRRPPRTAEWAGPIGPAHSCFT